MHIARTNAGSSQSFDTRPRSAHLLAGAVSLHRSMASGNCYSRKLNGAFQMVAATAIIWAVGLIIATYAGTPPSFIIISIVLWFLWIGWQIKQRNPESRWWD
jgi:hypothetical protein